MIVSLDIETDSLTPSVIWCVCVYEIENDSTHTFTTPAALQEYVNRHIVNVTWVVHNGITFDLLYLETLWGITFPKDKVIDTLVLSRLLHAKLEGGHSLEAWGERLKTSKGVFNDFSKLSDEMITYCTQDVKLTAMLYKYLMKRFDTKGFEKAIRCEMQSMWIARDMHLNGFKFDIDAATSMRATLESKLSTLLEQLQEAFPPRSKLIREVTPRLTQHGTISKVGISSWYKESDYTVFTAGCTFSRVEFIEFQPTSSKQVIDRMWEAGWEPVDKTDGHIEALKNRKETTQERLKHFKHYGWKINEVNLATLPETAPPACSLLVEYLLTAARVRTLTEWINVYNPETKRIHGSFNPLGTKTHRCSHSNPNLGNIANAKTIKYNGKHLRALAVSYGACMRSMWVCDDDAYLVGVDMESAHLRIFAHMINDRTFIHSLINGKKEDGTDPHTLNQKALGPVCVDRDRSKTFIFTFLNGGKGNKVSQIFNCSKQDANKALDSFITAYPGLQTLTSSVVPHDANRGYFKGIDGRLVVANQGEHGMIGMYLQNMESVLMKYANIMWRKYLDRFNIKYKQVNWVHDEWVTEVYGGYDVAVFVGQLQVKCIERVGRAFKLNCPMGGEYKVGKNWLEVH